MQPEQLQPIENIGGLLSSVGENMLKGFWRNAKDAPKCDFFVVGWWTVPEVRPGAKSVMILPITPAQVAPEQFRAHCLHVKQWLEDRNCLQNVFAICVAEELYNYVRSGYYDSIIGGMGLLDKIDAAKWWYENVGIPICKEIFNVPVTVEEHWFLNDRTLDYSPVPVNADVLTVLAYGEATGIHRYRTLEDFFHARVVEPVRRAVSYGKPVHVVGQSFQDTRPDQAMWAVMPPPQWIEMTQAFVATQPGIVALSWFTYDSGQHELIGANQFPEIAKLLP